METKELIEEQLKKRRKLNKKIFLFLGIPALVLWIFVIYHMISDTPQRKVNLQAEAYVISQNFVKANLKYPKTADFPYMEYKYTEIDSFTYIIKGNFTAENKLGMKVNSVYCVKLKYKGEGDNLLPNNWKLLDLKIE